MCLFSSAATGSFSEKNDIDLLISFSSEISPKEYVDNYFDLLYALDNPFGRKVNLLTENSLLNPYFIANVDRTKQLIYAACMFANTSIVNLR